MSQAFAAFAPCGCLAQVSFETGGVEYTQDEWVGRLIDTVDSALDYVCEQHLAAQLDYDEQTPEEVEDDRAFIRAEYLRARPLTLWNERTEELRRQRVPL